MNKNSNFLIIVPCFNEQKSIGPLLQEIKAAEPNADVLVIDDGSTDQTWVVAESNGAKVVRLVTNLGIGGAVQTGLKFADRYEYEYAIQVDGDGQHPPIEIRELFAGLKLNPEFDVVIGSRFIKNQGFNSTLSRRIGIRFISNFIALFFGVRISDPTSGYRLFSREAIKLFSREYARDYPEPISIARGLEAGLKIMEVPVRMRERVHGKSSIFGVGSFFYMLRVIAYIGLIRVGRHI